MKAAPEITKMVIFVSAPVHISDDVCNSIVSFTLSRLKSGTQYTEIINKLIQDKALDIGKSVAPDSEEAVKTFIEWLIGSEAQGIIASYKRNGEQLFYPDAG